MPYTRAYRLDEPIRIYSEPDEYSRRRYQTLKRRAILDDREPIVKWADKHGPLLNWSYFRPSLIFWEATSIVAFFGGIAYCLFVALASTANQ